MTTKEFVTLEKRLLPALSGLAIKGRLMFIPPVDHTLRGFNFEPSGFDKRGIYVTAFFLPLCVPRTHISYEFGRRLKGTGWRADAPDLEATLTEAMRKETPFLCSLRTVQDVVNAVMPFAENARDPYAHEAIAYMLVRCGNTNDALTAVGQLLASLDLAIPWQHEMAERAKSLKSQLLADPAAAQRQLDAWESETVKNLGLEEFR
jgi:hypothetical protein